MRRLSDRVAADLSDLDPALVERIVTATVKELYADLLDLSLHNRRQGDTLHADAYRALASNVFEQQVK